MGVISHKEAYFADAASKLAVIAGQNQCRLLVEVRAYLSEEDSGGCFLLSCFLLTVRGGPEEGAF